MSVSSVSIARAASWSRNVDSGVVVNGADELAEAKDASSDPTERGVSNVSAADVSVTRIHCMLKLVVFFFNGN